MKHRVISEFLKVNQEVDKLKYNDFIDRFHSTIMKHSQYLKTKIIEITLKILHRLSLYIQGVSS